MPVAQPASTEADFQMLFLQVPGYHKQPFSKLLDNRIIGFLGILPTDQEGKHCLSDRC